MSQINQLKKQISNLQEDFDLTQASTEPGELHFKKISSLKLKNTPTQTDYQNNLVRQTALIREETPPFNIKTVLMEAAFAKFVLPVVKKKLEPHLIYLQTIEETFLSKQSILDELYSRKPSVELLKTNFNALQTAF